MPTTPVSAAGWRIEPPVSVPSEKTTSPAATATAEPPDEPPGPRSARQGFFTGPNAEFTFELPIANSSRFVLPVDDGRRVRRDVSLEDARPGGGWYAFRSDDVLTRPWDASEQRGVARCEALVGRAGLSARRRAG